MAIEFSTMEARKPVSTLPRSQNGAVTIGSRREGKATNPPRTSGSPLEESERES
jgi:hypothetical protein